MAVQKVMRELKQWIRKYAVVCNFFLLKKFFDRCFWVWMTVDLSSIELLLNRAAYDFKNSRLEKSPTRNRIKAIIGKTMLNRRTWVMDMWKTSFPSYVNTTEKTRSFNWYFHKKHKHSWINLKFISHYAKRFVLTRSNRTSFISRIFFSSVSSFRLACRKLILRKYTTNKKKRLFYDAILAKK